MFFWWKDAFAPRRGARLDLAEVEASRTRARQWGWAKKGAVVWAYARLERYEFENGQQATKDKRAWECSVMGL
jgi:hypothetical protein